MVGKGGGKHTAKPLVDELLLERALSKHSSLLMNLGLYENISRTQATSPKGLLKVLILVKDLVDLESTCEIHNMSLRKAIFQVLLSEPGLNDSKLNGSSWVGLKVERLGVIMSHMRRLSGTDLSVCSGKLTGAEFVQLKEVVGRIQKKVEEKLPVESKEKPLVERGSGSKKVEEKLPVKREEKPLVERESSAPTVERKRLKKEISEVSLDSQGLPKLFGTPEVKGPLPKGREEGTEQVVAGERSFLHRRPGQLVSQRQQGGEKPLAEALGIKKRPAAQVSKSAKKKKGEQAEREKEEEEEEQVPWTKLAQTTTKKEPWRAYICGTHAPGGKGTMRLIVETTYVKSERYLEILEEIKRRLHTEHLTKKQAVALREELYRSM